MNSLIEREIYEQEKRKLGFQIHFIAFVAGIAVNWLIWLVWPSGHVWPIWPTLGWSVGITAHYLGIHASPWMQKRIAKRVQQHIKSNP